MNNSGPTAQIIEREGWRTAMDFVGHRKAVTVVVSLSLFCVKKPVRRSGIAPSAVMSSRVWVQIISWMIVDFPALASS